MKSFLKKAVIFASVLSVVAVGGWFGRKAYKRSTERRLISQATVFLDKKDFRNAALCLQRALQLNPMNADSCRLMGDMLDTVGAPAALGWRVRTVHLQPDTVSYRLLWAETALKLKDYRSAVEALESVDPKSRDTAAFHQLAGSLAWNTGRSADAEKHYLEASRLEPQNAANVLNINAVHMTSTNVVVARAARAELEQATTNATLRSPALHLLLTDAIGRKAFSEALTYSQEIVKDPAVPFTEKVDHLQLLFQTQHSGYQAWRVALEQDARHSPEHAFVLGRWVAVIEGVTNGLHWLYSLPLETQTNQPVPLLITDCQIAAKDWSGILALTQKQDWGEAEFYRLALQARAERSLGKTIASENSWHKTLRAAEHRLDRLERLAQVTGIWEWIPERTEVLSRIVGEFPKENWAVDQLASQLYVEGKTRDLQELYAKIYSTDPSNSRLKNNVASLSMLRKSDLNEAYRLAREAYESSADDPFCASTYAYSLFLQKRTDEALKVLDRIKPEYLQIPSVAAYYGVIQSESGRVDLAREPLKRAAAGKLLPEEKEIVRLASAGKL